MAGDYRPGKADSAFASILAGSKTAAELSPQARHAVGLTQALTADDLDSLDRNAVRPGDLGSSFETAVSRRQEAAQASPERAAAPPPAPPPNMTATAAPPLPSLVDASALPLPPSLVAQEDQPVTRQAPAPEPDAPPAPPPAPPAPPAPEEPAAPAEAPEEPTEPMEVPFEPREEPTPVERPTTELPPPAVDTAAGEWQEPPAEEIAAEPPTRNEVGKLFSAAAVNPLQYREILASKYKGEWLSWEPETLWWSIRRDFGPISDLVRNKIMALRTCLKTNTPWIDWDAFENVAQVFNDELPLFGEMQPLEPEDAAYAVSIMRELGDWEFGSEVSGYLAATCLVAGLVHAPGDLFPGAQLFIDRQQAASPIVGLVAQIWGKLSQQDPDALTDVKWREDNAVENQVKQLWMIASYLKHRRTTSPGQPSTSPPS